MSSEYIYISICLLILFYFLNGITSRSTMTFCVLLFIFKAMIIMTGLFESKLASGRPFELFSDQVYVINTFLFSTLINIPAFLLGAISYGPALTNAFLSILLPILFIKLFTHKLVYLRPVLVFTYLIPSNFYWGLFSLREYTIILSIYILTYGYLKKKNLLLITGIFFLLVSRPEYLLIVVFLILWAYTRHLKLTTKLLIYGVYLLSAAVVTEHVLDLTIRNFSSSTDIKFSAEIFEKIMDARFHRQFFSDGGATAFYSYEEYSAMTLGEKIFSNVIHTFLLIPEKFKTVYFVFLLDTVCLASILAGILLFGRVNRNTLVLTFLFLSGITLTGALMVNYGNAFRMRFPFIFMLSVAYLVKFYTRKPVHEK